MSKEDSKESQSETKHMKDSDSAEQKATKPRLSFGITRILGESRQRSRSLSPKKDRKDSSSDFEVDDSDADVISDHEQNDVEETRSESPSSSPTLSTSKYDGSLGQSPSIYPLDLASSAMFPLAGCGLYRGPHGVIKVPAQRPHPMMQLFTPYSIPWVDFRRDRFGGL